MPQRMGHFKRLLTTVDARPNPLKMAGMSDEPQRPRLSEKGLTEAERKRQRQAEALRANLHRRKAQSRARDDDAKPAEDEPQS